MSKKLIFINALGAELELTNTAPFLLQNFDTTNNVKIYSSNGMSQDGNTYLSNNLDSRDLSLEIAVIGSTTLDLINCRSKINSVFNPKCGEGWLIYKDDVKERKVKCIVNKLPYFKSLSSTVDTCLINITANNPFWFEVDETKADIALWLGDFSFPLELLPEGIEMGHREPSLITNVLNDGDVECGIRVEFKALANVVNPSILNVNSGDFIKINKAMVIGEVISVNTEFGSKKVESSINGVVTNAFNFIDFQSTFLQLESGDNLIRYNADSGIDNLEVSIYFTPKYLGV